MVRQRILALVVAVALLAGVCGCGGPGGKATNANKDHPTPPVQK